MITGIHIDYPSRACLQHIPHRPTHTTYLLRFDNGQCFWPFSDAYWKRFSACAVYKYIELNTLNTLFISTLSAFGIYADCVIVFDWCRWNVVCRADEIWRLLQHANAQHSKQQQFVSSLTSSRRRLLATGIYASLNRPLTLRNHGNEHLPSHLMNWPVSRSMQISVMLLPASRFIHSHHSGASVLLNKI